MDAVVAYVVSGDIAAGAVTPVDTATNSARSPIAIGGGAQSIVVTPNGKMVYVPNGVLNAVTPIATKSTRVTSWTIRKGGSFPVGASACKKPIFRNACVTATKALKYTASTMDAM